MDKLEIIGTPVLFDDNTQTNKISKITLGQPVFIKPSLRLQAGSGNPSGFNVIIRIKEASRFSFLMDDGRHVNGIEFSKFVSINHVLLDVTLIADGEIKKVKQVTFQFEINAPQLSPSFTQVTYAIK